MEISHGESVEISRNRRENRAVKVSAKVDYAIQALVEIALATSRDSLVSADEIATKHSIPNKFLEGILTNLRKSGIVNSYRGPSGGYELAKAPETIKVADIIRIMDGPLAAVRGLAPEEIDYRNSVKHVSDVWIATRVALRQVLERTSIAQILNGDFDSHVKKLLSEKDAGKRRRNNN